MIIKRILSYILGYVSVTVEGYFVERFINICLTKKILLSHMDREKSTILHAKIGIADFKKIREIARTTKCKVKITNKSGIPFLFKKYKKRKLFVIFLVSIIGCIFISSKFIWNIEIKGETKIPKDEIINELKEYGLNVGKYKKNINTQFIINEIRLKRSDISWIGIDIKGTNAIVEIIDGVQKPEIVNPEEYCNIISDQDAMITKISVQNGMAAVKEGDIVKKGTVLVNGYIEGKYTGIRYVHSEANIQAKVWYSEKAKAYKKVEEDVKTGKEEKKYSIKFNNFKINFYKTLSKFENYDTIEESKKITLFSNFYLPIEIIKTTNHETKKQMVTYDDEVLKENLIKQLENKIENRLSEGNVINKQINYTKEEDYIEIEVIYEVIQNIGTKEKIVF